MLYCFVIIVISIIIIEYLLLLLLLLDKYFKPKIMYYIVNE